MKGVSQSLARIIVVLASIALIVSIVMVSSSPIGEFFSSIVDTTTDKAALMLDSVTTPNNSAGPTLLDGNGSEFNKFAPTTLSFCSSAPISEFIEVKVDDETVDEDNYTVTEGPTIITLNADYISTLSEGDHDIEIVSNGGSAVGTFSVTNTSTELSTLTSKTWTGLASFNGDDIWTDGENIYYSDYTNQYVLNGDTWEKKTWNGLTKFVAMYIWTDGENIYYSDYTNQYVLNGDTWESKTWNGLTNFYSYHVWTDGANYYRSLGNSQYVLNGDTWEKKTWNGLTNFDGQYVWTDGENIYYSANSKQYVLNDDTWESKTWNGLTSFTGSCVWTDGENIYYSNNTSSLGTVGNYVLNGDIWEEKTWNGLTSFRGNFIWTDGENYYYANGNEQYVFS